MKDGVLTTGDSSVLSLKSFQHNQQDVMTNHDAPRVITISMTKKMINDEKSSGGNGRFWPKNTIVRGNSSFRTMQLQENSDDDACKNWLDSYGCFWDTV